MAVAAKIHKIVEHTILTACASQDDLCDVWLLIALCFDLLAGRARADCYVFVFVQTYMILQVRSMVSGLSGEPGDGLCSREKELFLNIQGRWEVIGSVAYFKAALSEFKATRSS